MRETIKQLNNHIESFLNGDIDGETFEKVYSNCYDFQDLEGEQELRYFQNVRTLLERFSPYESDLKKHSDYYINEKQLRANITDLKMQ
jgi:hypothetical protein